MVGAAGPARLARKQKVQFLLLKAWNPLRNQWWVQQGLNLRPLPCEGNALPLSYAPTLWRY